MSTKIKSALNIRGASILFIVFWVCFAITNNGVAQKVREGPKFVHLKENPLLSNLNISRIFQDSRGFLWVGTVDGLNRFDGYEFKVYRNIENDTASLFKNSINAIFEDSRGTLWVSTNNSGLHFYNRSLDVFNRVPEFSRQHCQITQVIEDSEQNVWIGGIMDSHAFVATLDNKSGSWKKYMLFEASEGIYSMIQYSEDEFWLGSRLDGLFKWNRKTNSLTQYLNDPLDPNSISGNYIQGIIKDKHDNIWIATRHNGLCKFNIKENLFTRFNARQGGDEPTILKDDIMDICLDNKNLWIAIENGGLSRMDIETEKITNFTYDKEDPTSIINNSLWSLHKDRQGRIWIGSFGKGLCVLDIHEKNFLSLDLTLENDLVNAILKDSKKRLWVGTEDGLFLLDKDAKYHFRFDPKDNQSLGSNAVMCFYEDHKNRVWVGLWNGGINRFDEKTKKFIRYFPDLNKQGSLTDPNVFAISEAVETGELLVGTFGGLHVLKDEQAGIFENIQDNPREGDQLLLTLLEDSHKNLWVGGFSGLRLYSLKTKKIKRISIRNDTTQVDDRVNCIFEDHMGGLWIGSFGGLHQMVSPDEFITYTIKDGLPVNAINSIQEDSKGNLWLTTTHGLVVFNMESKRFKTYDEGDGLNSAPLRDKAFFKDEDGRFFVGGKGINIFYPDSIFSNPNKPPVYLTDLKIFNRSIKPNDVDGILKNNISETKEIYLDYVHRYISIHYVGINYTGSYKNKYAYKLDGFDLDWNYVDNVRFAAYSSLEPGTYTFRVKASNNDGLWNEEGTSLIIHILPPWWETWWFRTLIMLGVVTIFFMIYTVRTRNIRRVNRQQEQIINQRTKELTETNEALLKREEEIELQNKKLTEQSEELAAQNEELIQTQEEISAQHDLVSLQNEKLLFSQKTIELQNENLEGEVAKRTKELVEYNQQLEQFAFISAHNLRSPVARILGLGYLLDRPENLPKEKEEIYPRLVHATKELDGVVRDLNVILELKRSNGLFITEVDLITEVLMIQESLEHEISFTQASITSDFSSISKIRTVKAYLDSILYNLISNAIKYRHPDRYPLIHIKAEQFENEYCLSVSDNGLGIDTSIFQDKLFTLYSRFHTHVEGKGMGLYLVKTQVISLGGRIEVESEVNTGTTFRAFFKA